MKAKIEKVFEVDHPIDRVWNFLSNPEKVVVCVPGASLTEKVDEEHYKGKVSLKFGPVSAKYNGEITIDQLDEANHHMILSGKGMDAKGNGSAGMAMNGILTSKAPELTEVNYNMDITVSGKLAQFGSRLIVDVSNQLVQQFISKFKSELDAIAEAETSPAETGANVNAGAATAHSNTASASASASPGDNSLNVFAIIGAIIKGFFNRLFGRKAQTNQD